MKIVEQYRHRAAECEKSAEEAISDLEIVRVWRELADQREQMLKEWSAS